jgi:hypothetical protein
MDGSSTRWTSMWGVAPVRTPKRQPSCWKMSRAIHWPQSWKASCHIIHVRKCTAFGPHEPSVRTVGRHRSMLTRFLPCLIDVSFRSYFIRGLLVRFRTSCFCRPYLLNDLIPLGVSEVFHFIFYRYRPNVIAIGANLSSRLFASY